MIWISHFTVTSHECHGVPSNGELDCLFNRLLRSNKENIKAQHNSPWGFHRWLGWCVATPSCSCLLQKILILNENMYEVKLKGGDVLQLLSTIQSKLRDRNISHYSDVTGALFVSNPQLLDCCFNSLLRLTTNNITNRHYGLLWGDPTGDWIGVLSNHHSQLHLT